ncbi:MAG: hypothetical protein LLG06_14820 [Desulfobacteraceae bacterium]|nr:hypothetical protein [Desulfobacteraceae bacterium]
MLIKDKAIPLVRKFGDLCRAPAAAWKRGTSWERTAVQLDDISRELEVLSGSSEGDFLALGEKLQDFYVRTGNLSRESSSIANLLSGEEVSGAIDAFQQIFDTVNRLEQRSAKSVERLREILDDLARMQAQLEGFRKTVMSLRVLCISTRVESARVGDERSGFGILSEEVARMAREIESKHEQLLELSESFRRLISETLGKVVSLDSVRREQAKRLFDSILTSLRALTEKHEQSSHVAAGITGRFEAIFRSTGEIVSSIQFHDITRQRIEHASESFRSLLNGGGGVVQTGESGGAGLWGAHRRSIAARGLRRSGRVCGLEAAQLRQAADELVEAVDTVIGNLGQIASNISRILEETRDLTGTADETERSFLSKLEGNVSLISSAMSGYGEARGALLSAMGSAGSTLGNMRQFAGDIQGIGMKLKLIALNAMVKASHMNEEGSALAALADAFHQLSVGSCGCIDQVTDSLGKVTKASVELSGQFGTDEGDGGMASISGALRAQIEVLRGVNDSVGAYLRDVCEEGAALAGDIRSTAEGVDMHHRISGVMHSATVELEGISTLAQSLFPEGVAAEDAEFIRALEASYTMEKERAVHQTILTTSAAGEVPGLEAGQGGTDAAGQGDQESSEEDLGDNVELF